MSQSRGKPWDRRDSLKAVLDGLTRNERLVVDLVARGWTNREIADELKLRPKTVEWTLTKVYRKLALRSRTELALEVARSNPGISLDVRREADPAKANVREARNGDGGVARGR